ncbi:Cupredoxin [Arabidopsis suecica]|uniref:Cupredoxin n=1 Tax=Arabidopsis suecica TaxID=45249 RepID=A0A8T2B3Q3_ARASU|nr:Cupredoxin [Arabidopsis suecica]
MIWDDFIIFLLLLRSNHDHKEDLWLCAHCSRVTITVLLGCCSGKIYKVGGSNGWSTKKNYRTEHKEFHVGDTLIFEYDENINDVTQVSDAFKYLSCDSSSPKAVYNTGHDVVTLKEPGYHYFISSNHTSNFYHYRTNYFTLLIFVLGLALIMGPLAIFGAALTALSLAFLNDSFAATFG